MSETRKLAAILVSDVVGYSRLAGADEDRILARLRTLRSDLIDPTIAVHHGRIVKRTGDGSIIEFRSVVDAVRCAIELQNAMIERNAGVPEDRRIEFRVGLHVGDVVEESDGDLMGDGEPATTIAQARPAMAAIGRAAFLIKRMRSVWVAMDGPVNGEGYGQGMILRTAWRPRKGRRRIAGGQSLRRSASRYDKSLSTRATAINRSRAICY
jgi:adenylate cyclase